jgi:hypothetical protein
VSVEAVVNQPSSTITTRAAQPVARSTTSKPLPRAAAVSTKKSPVAESDSLKPEQKDAVDVADSSSDADADDDRRWNEHEYYAKARKDMQKHHHEKIAKVWVTIAFLSSLCFTSIIIAFL